MLKDLEDFYSQAQKYVEMFNAFAVKFDLLSLAIADHICYKCDSRVAFEYIRSIMEKDSKFMYQSIIGGRRIAYIRLGKTFPSYLGEIKYLELSDQKPDGTQINSFDHIEFYPDSAMYNILLDRLQRKPSGANEMSNSRILDIRTEEGFKLRLTRQPLIRKIKSEEMV